MAGVLACGSAAEETPQPAQPITRSAPSVRHAPPSHAPPNQAPVLRSVELRPEEPVSGARVRAVVDATDADGDTLRFSYEWRVDGKRVGSGGATFAVPGDAKGSTVGVRVIATDGKAETAASAAHAKVANRPPKLESLVLEPGVEITVEEELAASARAVDPDGDPIEVRYRWEVNGEVVPERGRTLGSAYFERGDRIELEVVVSDGEAHTDPVRSPAISVMNSAPRILSVPSGIDRTGDFHYAVEVEDLDRDLRVRYRLLAAPQGMSIDWLSGVVVWRPLNVQAGRHHVEIEADDLHGGKAVQEFDLDLELVPGSPPAAAL